ncbi:MAG: PIN domain-containing protein [Deltaproteobacteria bacterium]|nr:MAG: PIN domain-containing protein [Deltaproteobacteria bacterium]
MRTAVDTSVLLDVFGADPQHGERSREALREAYRAGALLVCDVVWAEVRAHFAEDGEFREMLGLLGARFDPISAETSALAGRLWREYRGRSRARGARVVADFLVGAHARRQSDALLTRDRGFYRGCFSKLRILDPAGG